jgi:hypothetical protein
MNRFMVDVKSLNADEIEFDVYLHENYRSYKLFDNDLASEITVNVVTADKEGEKVAKKDKEMHDYPNDVDESYDYAAAARRAAGAARNDDDDDADADADTDRKADDDDDADADTDRKADDDDDNTDTGRKADDDDNTDTGRKADDDDDDNTDTGRKADDDNDDTDTDRKADAVSLWGITTRRVRVFRSGPEYGWKMSCTCCYPITMELLCRHCIAVIYYDRDMREKLENVVLSLTGQFWMLPTNVDIEHVNPITATATDTLINGCNNPAVASSSKSNKRKVTQKK